MDTELLLFIRMLHNGTMGIGFVLTIMESRYSIRKTLLWALAFYFLLVPLNIFIFHLWGFMVFSRIVFITFTMPSGLLFVFIGKSRLNQHLFLLLSALSLCGSIALLGSSLSLLYFDGNLAVDILLRTFIFPIFIFLAFKLLRKPYQIMTRQMPTGWGLLCLMPLGFFMASYFMMYHLQMQLIPFVFAFVLTHISSFGIVYIFFQQELTRIDEEQNRQLLETQIAGLQLQTETIQKNKTYITLQQHDMQYHMEAAAALLKSGNAAEALALLQANGELLTETAMASYCENTIIDAMISYYLNKAKLKGIHIETRLDIPDQLPDGLDAFELSAVFANALENAITACMGIPSADERKIRFICITHPCLTFEIANTFHKPISFDHQGMPLADAAGHGIGTRSIAGFAAKHNAMLDYDVNGRWFYMRVAL